MPKSQSTVFFRVTDIQDNMLDELQKRTGAFTRAEVCRQAIAEMYERIVTNGATARTSLTRSPGRPKTITKEDKELFKQKEICMNLNGELNGAGNGCKYFIYEQVGQNVEKYEQELPLSHLTAEHVEKQYKPDRRTIEKLLKKNKNK